MSYYSETDEDGALYITDRFKYWYELQFLKDLAANLKDGTRMKDTLVRSAQAIDEYRSSRAGAHWELTCSESVYRCSNCGFTVVTSEIREHSFCGYCGAMMDYPNNKNRLKTGEKKDVNDTQD